ncbi:MAG: hypothetical protein J6I96_01740 [Oscillospiraceae bacterium]|nr:hypothetical protein [Oscillospiraceae bacterium]
MKMKIAAAASLLAVMCLSVPVAADYYDPYGNIVYDSYNPNYNSGVYYDNGTPVLYDNTGTGVYYDNGYVPAGRVTTTSRVPTLNYSADGHSEPARTTTTPKTTRKVVVKKKVSASGWKNINGSTYYYKNGAPLKGRYKISGKTYYFSMTNGAMVRGFVKISGKYYYFGSDGVMCTGLTKINGNYYYFASNGAMRTGRIRINGVIHTFGSDGKLISPTYTTVVYYR